MTSAEFNQGYNARLTGHGMPREIWSDPRKSARYLRGCEVADKVKRGDAKCRVCGGGHMMTPACLIGGGIESQRPAPASAPAVVWIVTGESNNVPGSPMSAHTTEAGATAKAVELTNTLLEELDLPGDATAENWRERVETLEDETGGLSYVECYSLDLEA